MSHLPDDQRVRNMMQNYILQTRQRKEVKSNLGDQIKKLKANIDSDKKTIIQFMLATNKGYLNDVPPYIVIRAKTKTAGWKDDRIQAFIQQLLNDLQENKHSGMNAVDYGVDLFKTWRKQYETVYADIEETNKRPRFRTCDQLRQALIEQGDPMMMNLINDMQT